MKKIYVLLVLVFFLALVYADNLTTSIVINVPSADPCTPAYNQDWIIPIQCVKNLEEVNLGTGTLHIQVDGNLTLINSTVLIDGNISCTDLKVNSTQKKCIIFGVDSNINVHA